MTINKKGNYKYNGQIPEMGGDIVRGQDLIRDHWYNQDRIGKVLKDLGEEIPIIISGGVVTKGTGDTLNITACIGYHKYQIEIPDSFASVPPTKMNADIDAIRVESTQQTNMAISSAILNGSAVNYVKLRYIETNGNTRQRAKKVGIYSYELIPSFQFVVDTTAPTAYEICLKSFVGTAGGSFTFSDVATKIKPTFSTDATFASNSDLKYPSEKAINTNLSSLKYDRILFNSLRHIESWCSLAQACQDVIAEGDDYIVLGGFGSTGQYWRSYRGQTPEIKSTGATGAFDYPGKALYAGNNKWFLGFRGNGLWRTDNMSATTPTFVNCLVGTEDIRSMELVVENGEQVIYAVDYANKQFIKITNNGTTKTVIFTSANSIFTWAKCGNIIVLQSSSTIEYSPNNGTNWYTGSITLNGGRLMNSSLRIAVFRNAFFIATIYNGVAPQIFRSTDGNTWTAVYTGDTASYSSNVTMKNIDDKFLIWIEANTGGGYRFVYSFRDTLDIIEPKVVYATGTAYPVDWGFFKNSLLLLGSGTTPTLWRSPLFVE